MSDKRSKGESALRNVTNISAVAIIACIDHPDRILVEAKDDGHPIKLVHRQICLIGGNWVGEAAKKDDSPLATLCREITEELSLSRPRRSMLELSQLGLAGPELFNDPTPIVKTPSGSDAALLREIASKICDRPIPLSARVNTTSREAMQAADSASTREGFSTLCFYYAIFVSGDLWEELERLQREYGNLSNESVTLMTTLAEIDRAERRCCFGHDNGLMDYNEMYGSFGGTLPTVPGVTSERLVGFLGGNETYEAILREFTVAKRP